MRTALVCAAILVTSSSGPAHAATIHTKGGVTREGDIVGLVILKRQISQPTKGIAYLIVRGEHIHAIDANGVQLAKETLVRTVFVAGDESPTSVSDVGVALDTVKVGWKPEFAARPDFAVTIQLGRCCAIATVHATRLTDTILGEFREKIENTAAHVIPALETRRGESKATVPVSDIVSFVQ